jgi:hypothetical protein
MVLTSVSVLHEDAMSHDTASWPTTTEISDDSVPADALFDVLAHEYRRHALEYLLDHDAAPRHELIGHVASEVDGDEAHIATIFHHFHLPKMKDVEVIEYDEEIIELTTRGADTKAALQSQN